MPYKPLHFPNHLYFITATLLGWRPLLIRPEFAEIILDSLNWHRSQQRFALYAYVVMPNNPIAKKWRLATDRAEFTYSSAKFYDRGELPIVPVEDVREWLV